MNNLDINDYKSLMYTAKEMNKRRHRLISLQKLHSASDDMTLLNHPDYDIRISWDGMSAYFNWHCKHSINSAEELEFLLRKNVIFYGIDYHALSSIARTYKTIHDDTPKDQHTLIAKVTAPMNGRDGYYDFRFQTKKNRVLQLSNDGSIDFDNINWFEPVTKGLILAVYHSPMPTVNGKTATSMVIPATVEKEKTDTYRKRI